eukprot:g7066.t1
MKEYVIMEPDDENNRGSRRGYHRLEPGTKTANILPYMRDLKKTARERHDLRVFCQGFVEENEERLSRLLHRNPEELQNSSFCFVPAAMCIEGVDTSPRGYGGAFERWDALAARFMKAGGRAEQRQLIDEMVAAVRGTGGAFKASGNAYLSVMHELHAGGHTGHNCAVRVSGALKRLMTAAESAESHEGDTLSLSQNVTAWSRFGNATEKHTAQNALLLFDMRAPKTKMTGADAIFWSEWENTDVSPPVREGRNSVLDGIAAVFISLAQHAREQRLLLESVSKVHADIAQERKALQRSLRVRAGTSKKTKAARLTPAEREQAVKRLYVLCAFLGNQGDTIADKLDDRDVHVETRSAAALKAKFMANRATDSAPQILQRQMKP